MEDKNKAARLALLLAATMEEQDKTILRFENPYARIDPLTSYSGDTTYRPFKKAPLSKQQMKRRAANKKAKKARKRNR